MFFVQIDPHLKIDDVLITMHQPIITVVAATSK